jgi:hypothetical protein
MQLKIFHQLRATLEQDDARYGVGQLVGTDSSISSTDNDGVYCLSTQRSFSPFDVALNGLRNFPL